MTVKNNIKEFGFIRYGGSIESFDSIRGTHLGGGVGFSDFKRKRVVTYRVSEGVVYIKLFSKPSGKQMKAINKIRLPITFEYYRKEDFFDGEGTEISFRNFSRQVNEIFQGK